MSIMGSPKKRIQFYFKGKKISLEARECSFLRKGFGLMFRTNKTDNLIFSFPRNINSSLTSWFVFFPFLAIWLNSEGKIISLRVINPFTLTIKSEKKFRKVLEIPLNRDNMALVRFLVGKGKV